MAETLRPSAPYSRAVADYSPRALDGGVLRDIAALALLMAGVAGLSVAAFAFDWRLGLAVLSAAAIIAGVTLGYRR